MLRKYWIFGKIDGFDAFGKNQRNRSKSLLEFMNWNLRQTIEEEEKKRISNEELYEKQAQTLEILLDHGAINKYQYENGYQRLNVVYNKKTAERAKALHI